MGKLKFGYCSCCENYFSGDFSIVPDGDKFYLSDRSVSGNSIRGRYDTLADAVRTATRIHINRIRNARENLERMQMALS